jgi:DNA-binding NarL/FixJ family response regulator
MAFTGDLEQLPIVDIIQLVHTTRKSGIFSVKGDKGESRIVFSGGYIVGANHISNTVRIGTVLVKSGAITIDDLKQALGATNDAAQDHIPLMAVLMQMGKLKQEDAQRGLKKLVAMTIVELMSWTKGTFTFDTEASVFSSEGGASSDGGELDVGVDAQMVLMDALRIFDERERDRANGKVVPSFEELYADVLPEEHAGEIKGERSTITADDLGLADIERLEKKIPPPVSEVEIFDPVEIHRQKVKEMLAGFSSEDQEAFVSFLKRSADRKAAPEAAARQAGKAVVLFSSDKLIRHALMTICKDEGVAVFATDEEMDLERIVSQCLSAMKMPVVVFDSPARSEGGFPEETIIALRSRVREKYSAVPLLQLASPQESNFILRSYDDGVIAVLPKPLKEVRRETYIQDTIQFLGTFKSYISGFHYRPDATDKYVKELKKDIKSLREIANPSDAALVMLIAVAQMFERAVTFIVRPSELTGERAIGESSEKSLGPTQADRLKIPLSKPSIFRDVIEKGLAFYGESSDEALKELFKNIGKPLSPAVVLLPLISDRKVVAVVYGDFGKKVASPVHLDILEILAQQVGIVLEYALFRRQMTKAPQKP